MESSAEGTPPTRPMRSAEDNSTACPACRERRRQSISLASLRVSKLMFKFVALMTLYHLRSTAALDSSTDVSGTGLMISSIMPATGLAAGARVKMSYRFDPLSVPSSSAYLLLVDDDQLQTYYKLSTRSEDEFFRTVCNAPSALRIQLSPDGQPGSVEVKVPYLGQFTGLLVQCSGYYSGILRLQVNSSTMNPDTKGELVHHLGLEAVLLPQVYGALLAATVLLLVVWLLDLMLLHKYITAVHWAAAGALATLVLTLSYPYLSVNCVQIKMIQAAVQLGHYTRLDRDGTVTRAYAVGNNFVDKMSTISELLILFLLGLGWKVTRSQLTPREVRLLVLSFGFYFVFATAQSACSANPIPSKMCEAYVLTEYVVHSLILLGIIVSINFNLTHLRATLNDYPWSSNVPLQYQAMKDFQFYRLIFLLYLLLPTILLIIRIMLLSWAYSWLDELIHQGTVLAICVSVAVTFGPYERELYTRPFTPSEQGGSQTQQAEG